MSMMFKPIVHEVIVEDGDDKETFYVREPSGREILVSADEAKKREKDRPSIENARELFARYVVNQDGTKVTAERVDEILDMRLSAMQKLSEAVQEKIGLKKAAEKNV